MSATREAFIEAMAARGHDLWLVGGALRDQLLGRAQVDEDYATGALPDEVEEIARASGASVVTVGKRFGTIGVKLSGRWSEITTFRGDAYAGGSRWPEVSFGGSIVEDLARRDFTINALAANAVTGERIDPFGGTEDLQSGLIRAVGDPAARFREDPLRILRGLRFASQLGFDVEPGTFAGMCETASSIASLSQERITVELDKLLQGRDPERGLELLRRTGALDVALPELSPMAGCDQNSFHKFDVWGHTVATVAAIDGERGTERRVRRWAALLHDLGKPAVRHVKKNGEWGFYRHETVGAELAAALLERLRFGRRDAAQVVLLVRRHMDRPNVADRRSVRRFMAKVGPSWPDLLALKRADNVSHAYDDSPYHDTLERECRRIATEEAAALAAESPLTGDDLVTMFRRPPGPWIREIKDRLSELVLDGAIPPGSRMHAERVARRMMDGR